MPLYQAALEQLTKLMDEARSVGADDVNAAALATASRSARPSVRMITVLSVEPEGLLFFANLKSGKGHQLVDNPQASLCFYWPQLREQVIVEGRVEQQSDDVSDNYWRRRVRESQLASWAWQQSTPVPEGGTMRKQVGAYKSKFDFDPVNRHRDWYAFRIVPNRIEFWAAGWERARERVRYRRDEGGKWHKEILGP